MGFGTYIKLKTREILLHLKWDLTPNLRNDRLTIEAIKRLVKADSNCIDIGAHQGEITNLFLQFAPKGNHYAFEPIPSLNKKLNSKFKDKVIVKKEALSNQNGTATFELVQGRMAYSGLRKRTYPDKNTETTPIDVYTAKLDDVLPSNYKVDLIKIDIEGGEYHALMGARQILIKHRPAIVLEFGLGAADHYNVTPAMMYSYLTEELEYKIYNLSSFVAGAMPNDLASFSNCYNDNIEYYFVAVHR